MNPSHRPRYKGHDYYERGIYLITLVVKNRDHLLGELNMDTAHPGVNLTPLGEAVLEEWENLPALESQHGRSLRILAKVAMPDHFHGVLFVQERMDVSVGQVVWAFKVACAKRWRAIIGGDQPKTADDNDTGQPAPDKAASPNGAADGDPSVSMSQPLLAAPPTPPAPPASPAPPTPPTPPAPDPHRMSRAQRARYYSTLPRTQQPLFDDNYDDSILWAKGQLEAMLAYVADNPRRAILKARVPQFMQLRLCLTIGGVRYSAFGNLLLLRRPVKTRIFCHRYARMGQLTDEERRQHGYTAPSYHPDTRTSIPYTQTQAWQLERDAWIKDAQDGTVLVTPGISPGERDMKNIAINSRLPLIHLQKEPITKKPEGERFDACADGSLLILAPWPDDLDAMPSQLGGDYDRFHNMNLLAQQICEMDTVRTELSFHVVE